MYTLWRRPGHRAAWLAIEADLPSAVTALELVQRLGLRGEFLTKRTGERPQLDDEPQLSTVQPCRKRRRAANDATPTAGVRVYRVSTRGR